MAETLDVREFVGGFIAESEQLVASATAGLLDIERANAQGEVRPKTVRDLFRALHTLKGLAGMMAIEPIVELAHAFESVLRAADHAGGKLSPRAVELGLLAVRGIAERVRAVAEDRPVAPAPEPVIDELARVDTLAGAATPAPEIAGSWDGRLSPGERQQLATAIGAGRKIYTLTFTPSEQAAAEGRSIATVRPAVAALGEIIKVAPRAVAQGPDAPAGLLFDLLVISDADVASLAGAIGGGPDRVEPLVVPPAAAPALPTLPAEIDIGPIGRSFVRVELQRLDDLQDQLSALVVSRFRIERELARLAEVGVDARALREIIELQGRQLRDLRRGILRARMVPISEVLEPLSLLVRSLVTPGVKETKLELDTGDTEVDKAVGDRLFPAIVHLVRNAVDHGIEPVADREQAGKPRRGTIRISCDESSGNRLEIAVGDDGKGIDREQVARRAGHPIPDESALLDVLTTAGFSTQSTTTRTSGRGLGMDIVKRIVRELGGEMSLMTDVGIGTTFALRVPLTISIVDVFSFECAAQPFVVPVAAIEEIFEVTDCTHIDSPATARDRLRIALCERRGRAIPLVSLGTLLRLERAQPEASKALVIRRNGEPLAFSVDRMLGRHEVVVRPIEDVLARVPGIAGATDLGDGKPTLLLDLAELGSRIPSWRAEGLS